MGFLKKKQAESEGVGDVINEAPDLPPDDGLSQGAASAAGARQFPRAGTPLHATTSNQVNQAQKQRDAKLVAQFLASNYNLVPEKVSENTRKAAPALQAVLADQERMAAISDQVDQLIGGINQVYIKETKAVIATTLQRADAQEMVADAVTARAELSASARVDSDEAQMVADFIARNMNLLPEKIADNTLYAPQALLAVLGDEKRMAELDARVNDLLKGITQAYVEQTKVIIATTLGRQDAPQQLADAALQATPADQVDHAQTQREPEFEGSRSDSLPPELHLPTIIESMETQAPAPYLRTFDPTKDFTSNVIDVEVNEIADQPFADAYSRQNWAQRPVYGNGMGALDPLLADQNSQQLHPAGGAGVGNVDMLSKLLSAPFALTAAAGSMVMNSLKAIGGKAKSYYAKELINGHAILAAQLDQHASEVSSLTKSLRKQGMDGLIDAMRATGRPAREVCAGMASGGPYEHLGKRFSDLMQDDDFSKNYARLNEVLDEFNFNASRYAASGVELDLDYSDAIDRNLESISSATEGFLQEKDGVIKHLQEMAKQIGERISELVNSLMGRLRPQ